jgi:GT2 family glycosyltransferase
MPERLTLPSPASPRVSVILPAAARPELLHACLRSLALHGPREIPFETLVVQNAPSSAAETLLREIVSGVRIVASPVNLGLAGAGNRGRALARGEYLVLLHDDAEVEPGWLQALVEAAEAHPEAGAVGGKVLHPDGSLQNAGMILWRDATTAPPWVGRTPPPTAFDLPRAVDYCGTSSLLVRAATWDAVGGLDERFFPAYYVDVDLGMAIRQLGQVVWYEPRSVIRHHRGASGEIRFRVFVTERNRRLFLEKWEQALAEHGPREDDSAVAIARALARAEGQAEKARHENARQTPPLVAPRERIACDPAREERHGLERNLALLSAYADHLTAALDEALAEDARLREALEVAAAEKTAKVRELAELPELRARAATLAAIERGLWWRLYLRLLPLLRFLRGAG